MKFVKRDPDKAYLDCMLHVPKVGVNVDGVKNALTFYLQDGMGEVRYLELYTESEHHIAVPRAFWNPEDMDVEVVDCRPKSYAKVDIRSKIVLDAKNPHRTTQQDAVNAIMPADGGILQLACGLGKTVVALEVAARKKVPTLIVVNNTNLMKQWSEEIERHLVVPGGVGIIQAENFDWKKPIVLATYQTLANRADGIAEEVRKWFGFIVLDEGHHAAAPWFCRAVPLFYGTRLILTATPDRNDGAHVVYNFHVGNLLYKDLKQELTPKFQFLWTGLSLDMKNPLVKQAVVDKKGELHLSRLAGYFGQWRERLDIILNRVRLHEAAGRKVMVLSTSVGELVNLLSLYNGASELYTDIPYPTPAEFGSSLLPRRMSKKARARIELEHKRAKLALYDKDLNASKKTIIKEKMIPHIEEKLAQDELAAKIEREYTKRQRQFVKERISVQSTAGLMIAKVPLATRMEMLKTKQTVFAIYQYGLEGLDNADLDTVVACEPMTSKNNIQQFMGRILRPRAYKKEPLVEFLEDDIGPIIGMCKIIRQHLRSWPIDEGGPYRYEQIGHPNAGRIQWLRTRKRIGQSSFQGSPST